MELIEKLRALKQPDRRVDIEIAMLAGYRREIDEKERRVLWFDSNGSDPVRIPPYTSSIDNARDFARFLVPGYVGGCSWELGLGSARINNGPYIEAVSPEIALCIAALHANIKRETEEQS
jgi:hypothetical protein